MIISNDYYDYDKMIIIVFWSLFYDFFIEVVQYFWIFDQVMTVFEIELVCTFISSKTFCLM